MQPINAMCRVVSREQNGTGAVFHPREQQQVVGPELSLAARETIIATLGAIYGMDGESNQTGLQQVLQHDLTPGGAVALLIFFAFAMQCISTIAVVRRET